MWPSVMLHLFTGKLMENKSKLAVVELNVELSKSRLKPNPEIQASFTSVFINFTWSLDVHCYVVIR